MIVRPVSLAEQFSAFGMIDNDKRGLSTGFKNLDLRMRLIKGYMSIITGYPSSGKSEFLDMLLVNMSVQTSNWHHLVFSPENKPIEGHMNKIAEKYIGKPSRDFTPTEMRQALVWLDEHFTWLNPAVPSLDAILRLAQEVADNRFLDSVVIDPWNEVLHDKHGSMTHEYLSDALMKIRNFGKNNNTHMFIVAHPKIPVKDKNGCYGLPELYDISDGAMWRNKADYGWVAHRPDMSKNQMEVSVQKIKYKYMGKIMPPLLFDYDCPTGRFKETTDQHYTIPTALPFT